LLPAEQFSPKQFEKLFLVISSDQVGVFTLEIIHPGGPVPELGSCEIRMEDLLQAKFENKATLDMFDQVARVRVNTLIFLINKSELAYGTSSVSMRGTDGPLLGLAEFYA
jgi:Ras GTPase-activating-like protein IQGAP2/3